MDNIKSPILQNIQVIPRNKTSFIILPTALVFLTAALIFSYGLVGTAFAQNSDNGSQLEKAIKRISDNIQKIKDKAGDSNERASEALQKVLERLSFIRNR